MLSGDFLVILDNSCLFRLRETQNALQLPVSWGGVFSFFQGIHVRINIRIDIYISLRPLITKFGKQVHLQDLTQMKLIKQALVTSSLQDHVIN